MLEDIWAAFMGGFKHFFIGMIKALNGGGEPDGAVERAGAIMTEAMEATFLLLVQGGGIANAGSFLIELKSIHDQVQQSPSTGDEKYAVATQAIHILWQRYGGKLDNQALPTLVDIFTSILHAPVKAKEMGLAVS